jgi:cytochrome c peroxidase
MRRYLAVLTLAAVVACSGDDVAGPASIPPETGPLTDAQVDAALGRLLVSHGFTGRMSLMLPARLGRSIDARMADLGRLLFFDPLLGLNDDNSCAGCHAPQHGFGDAMSIAIGIENNGIVGPGRTGPRNQRRTPQLLNSAFFPKLMWNSRFFARSGNPFDNSSAFAFPDPEGSTLSHMPHLLNAQAFIPPTERVEMAGFDFEGDNFAIRDEVLRRINGVAAYRGKFGEVFPAARARGSATYQEVGMAIGEFTFSLNFANAPIDQYARGNKAAMTISQKRGAILFFGKAGCVQCHAVSGTSNEMFSDFSEHVIGVPQIAPDNGNVVFDGPGEDEDFGLEQVTRNSNDRYAFRTSPIRNVALQTTFMHNGAYTRLEDAIRHHFHPYEYAINYDPHAAGVAPDLWTRLGPITPVLQRLDPKMREPMECTDEEIAQLVDFVRFGLLDPAATAAKLRSMIPTSLPSGKALHTFR